MLLSAEGYANNVLDELRSLRTAVLPVIERAAEVMARRVLQGGRLYIVDDRSGLTSEAVGRAGGLMMIQPLPTTDLEKAGIASPDVMLMCSRKAENTSMSILARDARQRGVYVIALCPSGYSEGDLVLPGEASVHLPVPSDGSVLSVPGGNRVCPVSGIVACAALWALVAAFIERMHMHGKTPHIWRSIKLPDSKVLNEAALESTAREGF